MAIHQFLSLFPDNFGCLRPTKNCTPRTGKGWFSQRSSIANIERGRQVSTRDFWQRCDVVLRAHGSLIRSYDELQELQARRHREAADALSAYREVDNDGIPVAALNGVLVAWARLPGSDASLSLPQAIETFAHYRSYFWQMTAVATLALASGAISQAVFGATVVVVVATTLVTPPLLRLVLRRAPVPDSVPVLVA